MSGTISVGRAFEKGALLIERLLVNLALDSRVDLLPQNTPVRARLGHRKSFPECLSKTYEKFHRDVMLLKSFCHDRHLQSAGCCGPSRSHVEFSLRHQCDSTRT